MKSQRIVATAQSKIAVEDFELPSLEPDQVLIETQFSAISPGTELAFLHHLPNTPGVYPYYPGYSSSGHVADKGSAVTDLEVGQRVACKIRHAAHAIVEAGRCIPIPDGVSNQDASIYRLISIVMQGIHKAQVQLGWEVAVLGLGSIGNLAGQVARAAGSTHVHGFDPVGWRRDLALQSGFDAVSDSTEIGTLTDRFQAVIEATGVAEVVPSSFHLAARLGHVVLLASTRGETESVNFYRDVHKKGLTIFGAHDAIRPQTEDHLGFTTEQTDDLTALRLVASGRVQAKPIISDVVSYQDATSAYQRLTRRDEALMMIVLQWK